MTLRRLAGLFTCLSLLSLPAIASADMPGNDVCHQEDGCVVCNDSFGEGGGAGATYDQCVADAKAAGLTLSCSELAGSSSDEYYCPDGVDANNGGCSVRALGSGRSIAVGLGLAVAAFALARRRRRP